MFPEHPKHGDVSDWPINWGEVGKLTCDWDDCDLPAIRARYDGRGHGWLPVCADHAIEPIDDEFGD